jgi:hypothetical protein
MTKPLAAAAIVALGLALEAGFLLQIAVPPAGPRVAPALEARADGGAALPRSTGAEAQAKPAAPCRASSSC